MYEFVFKRGNGNNQYQRNYGAGGAIDFQNDDLTKLTTFMRKKYAVTFVQTPSRGAEGRGVYGAAWGSRGKASAEQTARNVIKALVYTFDDAKSRGFNLDKLRMQVVRRDASSNTVDGNQVLAMGSMGGRKVSVGTAALSADYVASRKPQRDALGHLEAQVKPGIMADTALGAGDTPTYAEGLEFAAGIIRHEIGHNLTKPRHVKALMRSGVESILGNAHSSYSESDAHEFLAEAFTKYSAKGYKRDTFTPDITRILEDIAKPLR